MGDYTEDLQLQRAILELLLQNGRRRDEIPQAYRKPAELHFGAEELQRQQRE